MTANQAGNHPFCSVCYYALNGGALRACAVSADTARLIPALRWCLSPWHASHPKDHRDTRTLCMHALWSALAATSADATSPGLHNLSASGVLTVHTAHLLYRRMMSSRREVPPVVTMTSTLRCLPSSLQTWEFWRASSRVGTRIMAAGQHVRDVMRGAMGKSASNRMPQHSHRLLTAQLVGCIRITSAGQTAAQKRVKFACRSLQFCCL